VFGLDRVMANYSSDLMVTAALKTISSTSARVSKIVQSDSRGPRYFESGAMGEILVEVSNSPKKIYGEAEAF
jgi:hypothetical protein